LANEFFNYRKLNEELDKLYASPNIIRGIKTMRGVGHVVRMGEMRNAYNVLDENMKEETSRKT
jgi:hypothetical protein